MSFKTDLYDYLSTYPGLTALVGKKIYRVKVDQRAQPPYITWQIVSNIRTYSHQGNSGLNKISLQISCFANTTVENDAIAAQVAMAIDAWPGSNSKVQSAFVEDDPDNYEEDTDRFFIPVEAVIQYGD